MGTVLGDKAKQLKASEGDHSTGMAVRRGRGLSTATVDPRGLRESVSGPGRGSAPSSTMDGRASDSSRRAAAARALPPMHIVRGLARVWACGRVLAPRCKEQQMAASEGPSQGPDTRAPHL